MKAGTAQKLMLNMLSTAVMIRLGRVDPVTNSGPTTASRAYSASAATGDAGLQVIEAVSSP